MLRCLFALFIICGVVMYPDYALADEWREVVPDASEGTVCARGAPFSFFVADGDPERLVLDFAGGGACWDASTCGVGSATFTDTVDPFRDGLKAPGGVYRRADARNPYKGWTHVGIPYCTGDVHWGDATVTYRKGLTIEHKGAVNTRAVLKYVHETYPSVKEVLVSGCSAGSYGSVWWTPHVRELYPAAKISQFGDSGAGILTEKFQTTSMPGWNVVASAPSWVSGLDPAEVDYTKLTLTEFYTKLAGHYPDVSFSQYNHRGDAVQSGFYWRMGGNPLKWAGKMLDSQRTLVGLANYRSYLDNGSDHCVVTTDSFYSTAVGDAKLSDWLGVLLGGSLPENVGNLAD